MGSKTPSLSTFLCSNDRHGFEEVSWRHGVLIMCMGPSILFDNTFIYLFIYFMLFPQNKHINKKFKIQNIYKTLKITFLCHIITFFFSNKKQKYTL